MLFAGLQSLHPTDGCMEAFRSFWCLVLFGLCDGSGQRRLPSYGECITLQEGSCAVEKQIARGIPNLAPLFPECEIFRLNTPLCRNENENGEHLPSNITCSDQFYFDESSMLCKPECGAWTQHSDTTAKTIKAFIIFGDVLGVVLCTAVIIASLFQRKRMFTFPPILILYQTAVILIYVLLDLFHYLPKSAGVCSSKDLTENLKFENSTPLCKFLGGLFVYTVLVTALLWLFHILLVSWAVIRPIVFHAYSNSGKMKYIHLTVVALSLFLPIISVLICHLSEGIGLTLLTYYKCATQGPHDTFYAVIVPLDIVIIIGTSLLVCILWITADVKNRCKGRASKSRMIVQTPDIKLMIIFFYYFLLSLFNITTSSIVTSKGESLKNEVVKHFTCEALGNNIESNCSKENFDKSDAVMLTLNYIMYSVLPSIFFIYIIQCKLQYCRRIKKQQSFSDTT